jgi:FKBP-type peptidyl-prolyl cis-trans isomerase SlyD
MAATAMKGNLITLEFSFRSEDSQLVNSNVGKSPLIYTQGAHEVIPGVETAVEGMMVGETKHVVVPPVDGFGPRDPHAVQEVHTHKLPRDITVGAHLRLHDKSGRELRPTVMQITDHTALLDFNHPLAGKTLFVDLKVVRID